MSFRFFSRSRMVAGITGFALLSTLALAANAQVPSNYNHPISGITINMDGSSSVNPSVYGFTTGTSVNFAGFGTYSLLSVRSFSLLYNDNSSVAWSASNTVPIGSAAFGAQQAWKPETISGKQTGWEDSFNSKGSQKPGNIGPSSSSGLVFNIGRQITNAELPDYFGFDLAVRIGANQLDPFGNGTTAGNISTGRVYEVIERNPPQGVPEPGSLALFAGLGVSGLAVLRSRRKRTTS